METTKIRSVGSFCFEKRLTSVKVDDATQVYAHMQPVDLYLGMCRVKFKKTLGKSARKPIDLIPEN